MSFTANIKGELCRISAESRCCPRAELAGFIVTNGNLLLSTGGVVHLNIVTEHAFVARHIYRLIKSQFGFVPAVLARKRARLKKNVTYLVQVADSGQARQVISDLGILDGRHIPGSPGRQLLSRKCCKRGYLRGCFLAGGSVSSPESHGYHLEIATEYSAHAQFVRELMSSLGIKSGQIKRKRQQVVYVKDSEQIAQFLTIIGTSKGRLEFENARIYKEMRNKVNRIVNCETANVGKTVNASQRQVAAIRKLQLNQILQSLSPGLREVAMLRLEMPEATLEELGQEAGLSKSAVNYRLRKLLKIAASLRHN